MHEDGRGDLLRDRIGLRADGAGGHLCVLRPDGCEDVVGRQPQPEHLVGIHPDAHGALRRKERRAADARNAADFTHHIAIEVVAEADRIGIAVGGSERDHEQEARAGLLDAHALLHHGLRQPRLDAANPVLHLDLRFADVRSRLEGRGELDAAGGV